MKTLDSLSAETKAVMEEFLHRVKTRITLTTTEFLNVQFHLFCKKVNDADRLIFLKAKVFGGTTNYISHSSHIIFTKLLSNPSFVEMMDSIKQAVTEKTTIDTLRLEIKKYMNEDTAKKIILEELNLSFLEINSENKAQKLLSDFSQTKIQNLIDEANRWYIDAQDIVSTIRAAAMDPVLFYNSKVNIFSIIEVLPGAGTEEKIN